MDYSLPNSTLMFDACESRSCIPVLITDDNVLESEESLNVDLERNGVIRGHAVVFILDDDGLSSSENLLLLECVCIYLPLSIVVTLGLEETEYSITEGVSSVEVCVNVFEHSQTLPCITAISLIVTFSTQDLTAGKQ